MHGADESIKNIMDLYGLDVSVFPRSSYYINEKTEMLVISDRTKIEFGGNVQPKEVVYGSFSDSYFYYFEKLGGDNE
jgi:hypothetical protein